MSRTCDSCMTTWTNRAPECPVCGSVEYCAYVPSLQEIEDAKVRIRASWTPGEERKRAGVRRDQDVTCGVAIVRSYMNGRVMRMQIRES